MKSHFFKVALLEGLMKRVGQSGQALGALPPAKDKFATHKGRELGRAPPTEAKGSTPPPLNGGARG